MIAIYYTYFTVLYFTLLHYVLSCFNIYKYLCGRTKFIVKDLVNYIDARRLVQKKAVNWFKPNI